MPMNRTHMRRQLYKGGGIADLYPRQKYGIGSWVKERVRKLIPNELADVAVKAAPFVAPFNPALAGMMRGIGRFDQRGSISDALKQGIGTWAGGQGARMLGGAPLQTGNPFTQGGAFTKEGFRSGFSSPLSPERTQSFKDLFRGSGKKQVEGMPKNLGDTGGSMDQMSGALTDSGTRATGDFSLKGIMKKWDQLGPGMQTAIVGVGSGSLAGLAQWFENQIPQEEGEDMTAYLARRKVAVKKLMRQYMDNTRAYDAAWSSMTDQQKDETVGQYYNQGGRVGYRFGPGPVMDPRVAQPQGIRGLSSRFNFMPGPPRMAPDGIEFDMRENGGFQPLGAKEKKDDVPAMLAKNEFVFTADAVRGAGGGDIELGAQRMYDTMKNLEKRMT